MISLFGRHIAFTTFFNYFERSKSVMQPRGYCMKFVNKNIYEIIHLYVPTKMNGWTVKPKTQIIILKT